MNRVTMKEKAKNSIKGRVLYSFLIVFVAGLPGTVFSSMYFSEESTVAVFATLLMAAGYFLSVIFRYGVLLYFHKTANGENGNFDGFFEPFKSKFAGEIFLAQLIATLYIVLGTLLFVIPGIYFALKYSQVNYAFLENPQIKHKDALKRSAEVMKGNILEYIILELSFIGWQLLVPFTLGLIMLYVAPYLEATKLQFYYDKSGMLNVTQKDDDSEVLLGNVDDVYGMDDSDFWKHK